MKKHIKQSKFLKLAAFSLLFAFGCDTEKLLNPAPPTSLSDLNAFDTPTRVLQQVNGLYATLKNGQFLGGRMQVYHEVRGEDFQNRLGNGVTALFTWQYNQVSTNAEPLNAWSQGFLTINRCNVFLQGLDDNPNAVETAVANNYRAEARFVRALTYYFLVNLYARPFAIQNGGTPGLPLRLVAETSPANRNLARSTVAQVYEQILTDLNFAEQNLPLNYGNPTLNVTRAHKNTAIAFKTRVLLTMQRYPDVVTEASKIASQTVAPFSATSGVSHALASSIRTVFTKSYTGSEAILSLPFNTNDVPGVQNSLNHYFTQPGAGENFGQGEYYLDRGTQGIFNNAAFTATDKRRTELTLTVGDAPNDLTYLTKFPSNPAIDWAPVTRYAEVLLNYAEALVRANSTVDLTALELLNAVRGRSAPTEVYTAASFATSDDLLNAILLERRIELIGEGFRGIDITRQALPLPAKSGVAGTVPTTSQQYIFPIPQAELDNNNLMVQNN